MAQRKSRPGKYDSLYHTLPKSHGTEEARQVRLDVEKQKIREDGHYVSTITLAMQYMKLRAQQTEAMATLAKINLKTEACAQLLVESQTAREDGWGKHGAPWNGLRMENGALISVQSAPHTTITNQDAVKQWYIAHGLENALTVPFPRVNNLNKERVLHNEEELPGTSVFMKQKIAYYPRQSDKPEDDVEMVFDESDNEDLFGEL